MLYSLIPVRRRAVTWSCVFRRQQTGVWSSELPLPVSWIDADAVTRTQEGDTQGSVIKSTVWHIHSVTLIGTESKKLVMMDRATVDGPVIHS